MSAGLRERCQRCGSDKWRLWMDYRGCSDCRDLEAEAAEDRKCVEQAARHRALTDPGTGNPPNFHDGPLAGGAGSVLTDPGSVSPSPARPTTAPDGASQEVLPVRAAEEKNEPGGEETVPLRVGAPTCRAVDRSAAAAERLSHGARGDSVGHRESDRGLARLEPDERGFMVESGTAPDPASLNGPSEHLESHADNRTPDPFGAAPEPSVIRALIDAVTPPHPDSVPQWGSPDWRLSAIAANLASADLLAALVALEAREEQLMRERDQWQAVAENREAIVSDALGQYRDSMKDEA